MTRCAASCSAPLERDVGEVGIPGLQRDDGERGALHAHQIDGEALAAVEAERVGEVHHRIRHQRRRGVGDDQTQPFGGGGLDGSAEPRRAQHRPRDRPREARLQSVPCGSCFAWLPPPRRCGCPLAAVVRTRCRAAQTGRNLAIVDPLLVAGLAAEPFLAGADGGCCLDLSYRIVLARSRARRRRSGLRHECLRHPPSVCVTRVCAMSVCAISVIAAMQAGVRSIIALDITNPWLILG